MAFTDTWEIKDDAEIWPLMVGKDTEDPADTERQVEVILNSIPAIPAGQRALEIGCVDKDTEYLSPTGWNFISQYNGTKVMQYYPDTGTAEFVTPNAYIVRAESEFLHFKTKYGIDQMLSPDHTVLCWDWVGWPQRSVMRTMSAEDFAKDHNRLKLGRKSMFETSFKPEISSRVDLTDDQIRIQIMLAADGSIRKDCHRVKVAFRKKRKIIRAINLLKAAGIPYIKAVYGLDTEIKFVPPVRTKSLDIFWSASLDQLRIIAEECLHWDGSVNSHRFFSSNKASADFIHYVFAATGKRSAMRTVYREGKENPEHVVRYTDNSRTGMEASPKSDIAKVPSRDGKSYCFSVPSGFLVLRRNGNIFITGNCGVGRLVRAISSTGRFNEVCGVDSSMSIVLASQEYLRDHPAVTVHLGDGINLPFPDNHFDFVFSFTSFQHFISLALIHRNLHEIRRVLVPGGLCRIQTISSNGDDPRDLKTYDGRVFRNVSEFAEQFRDVGLEVIGTAVGLSHPKHVWVTARKCNA